MDFGFWGFWPIPPNWDWVVYDDASVDQGKKWGVIRVYNEGRRPVYVTHVLIALPKGYDEGHLLIKESMRGAKLDEGDRPELYMMAQEGMEKYAKDWKRLRAEVLCSNNKTYKAKATRKTIPSWAQEYERKRKQMSAWARIRARR